MLFFIWISIGPLLGGEGAFSSELLLLRTVYAALCSIALNIAARANFPLKNLIAAFLALFFTLLSPYAVPLGAALIMVPYFGGMALIGEVSNPPFSRCESLPHGSELKDAVKAGFNVNGKCCFDTMIGSCILVTPDNRTEPNIDAVMTSPLYSDDEILAYFEIGAIPTVKSLLEASTFRSESVMKRALNGNYALKDYVKSYVNSWTKNVKVAPLIRGAVLSRFSEISLKEDLVKEVQERLSEAYSGIHYRDSTSEVDGLKRLIKEEAIMSERETSEALLCSLLNQPRTVSHKTEETKARFDSALESLLTLKVNGDAKCFSKGSSIDVSLRERANFRASNCQGEDCDVYKKILRVF